MDICIFQSQPPYYSWCQHLMHISWIHLFQTNQYKVKRITGENPIFNWSYKKWWKQIKKFDLLLVREKWKQKFCFSPASRLMGRDHILSKIISEVKKITVFAFFCFVLDSFTLVTEPPQGQKLWVQWKVTATCFHVRLEVHCQFWHAKYSGTGWIMLCTKGKLRCWYHVQALFEV